MKKLVFALMFCGFLFVQSGDNATGKEPGWSLQVIATGKFRQQIRSTPIEHRPYRPFHVYGNTVRRRHYRGTALPLPRETRRIVAFSR